MRGEIRDTFAAYSNTFFIYVLQDKEEMLGGHEGMIRTHEIRMTFVALGFLVVCHEKGVIPNYVYEHAPEFVCKFEKYLDLMEIYDTERADKLAKWEYEIRAALNAIL
jgi:hypothetical protein